MANQNKKKCLPMNPRRFYNLSSLEPLIVISTLWTTLNVFNETTTVCGISTPTYPLASTLPLLIKSLHAHNNFIALSSLTTQPRYFGWVKLTLVILHHHTTSTSHATQRSFTHSVIFHNTTVTPLNRYTA